MQAQCWICPKCYDDKHHEPDDTHCLRQQLHQAQTERYEALRRVAELEDAISRCAVTAKDGGWLDKALHDSLLFALNGNGRAWLLRKQAEAVTKAGNHAHGVLFESGEMCKESGTATGAIMEYAQSLRQQADELEA